MVQFQWLSPIYLWTLPCISIFFFLCAYALFKQRSIVQMLANNRNRTYVIYHFSFIKKIIKFLCAFLGLLFLWIALARLAVEEKQETIAQEGRDLFIALDISRSMLAQDRKPDRLTFAKEKIRQFLKSFNVERVGLIVFSGSTFVQCPLTHDYGAFTMYLDQLDVETISSGTTAIDQAIGAALEAFKSVGERKNKLLILFTDGEDFSSNLSGIKQQAQKSGLHIFAVGIGTPEGAPIPLYDARGNLIGHQKDDRGNVVISRLNEDILKNIAYDSGGQYVTATDGSTDINGIIKAIRSYEKEYLHDAPYRQIVEYYHYPLMISFFFYALEWIL